MKNNKELDAAFEQTTARVRAERMTSKAVETAARRVLERLSDAAEVAPAEIAPADHIRTCADFQTLIPAFLGGRLSETRTLLFEDHTRECVPCRKALKEARTGRSAGAPAAARPFSSSSPAPMWRKWAVAASFIVGLGLVGFAALQSFSPSVAADTARIESLDGGAYLVTDSNTRALAVGETLRAGEKIRTGKNSRAFIRLGDDSLVELNERTEFSVAPSLNGTTIRLAHGQIIVQAAARRSGNLFTATDDGLVSGNGAVYAVNNGTKGSRVSFVQGFGVVGFSGREQTLAAGEQTTTGPTVEPAPIKQEVAWSRDADRYAKILDGLAALRKEIEQNVSRPGIRRASPLLGLVPENIVFYLALPNIGTTLSDSNRIIQARLSQNPELREWWEKNTPHGNDAEFTRVIEEVRAFSEHLGDEIVVTAENGTRRGEGLLVLAQVKNEAGFRAYFEQLPAKLAAESKGKAKIRLVDDPTAAAAGKDELVAWIHDGFFVAGANVESLKSVQARLTTPNDARTPRNSFQSAIAQEYQSGVELILAADMERIISTPTEKSRDALDRLGAGNVRHLLVNLKSREGVADNRAVLTFKESRRGVASWLAAPGPMGSLEFVSPNANIAGGFIVKDPKLVIDELFAVIGRVDPSFQTTLKDLEAKHGLSLRDDFIAPLGGEITVALDGPVLPTPSWKIIIEVNDPTKLQGGLERAVEEVNKLLAEHGKGGLAWIKEVSGGHTFYTLKSRDGLGELTYAYIDGYLIAAPSRQLIEQSLRYRESGVTLVRSEKFLAALPKDGNTNFSAVLYQNLGDVLKKAEELAGREKNQVPNFEGLNVAALPTAMYAYAYDDRIVFMTGGGALGFNPATLLGVPGTGIGTMMKQSIKK